jgi:hypothetical protein
MRDHHLFLMNVTLVWNFQGIYNTKSLDGAINFRGTNRHALWKYTIPPRV